MFRKFFSFLFNDKGSFMGEEENEGDSGNDSSSDSSDNDSDAGDSGDSIQYPEGFDESLKGYDGLKKFLNEDGKSFNYANVLKSYAHMEKVMGGEKMLAPTKDFTDEQWKHTFRKLGVPESIDEYKLENKIVEGVTPNEKLVESFRNKAHELNLLPNQAQGVLDYFNDTIGEQTRTSQQMIEEQLTQSKEDLQKEWGSNYEKNLKTATVGLKQFASPEEIKYLGEVGFLDDKIVTKLFHKIGNGLAEDQLFNEEGKGSYGMSEDDIRKELNAYYDKNHPYMNSADPQHKYYVEKHFELHKKLEELKA